MGKLTNTQLIKELEKAESLVRLETNHGTYRGYCRAVIQYSDARDEMIKRRLPL